MSLPQKIVLALGGIAMVAVLAFFPATKFVTVRNPNYDPDRKSKGYFNFNTPYRQEKQIDYMKTGSRVLSVVVGVGVLYLLIRPEKKEEGKKDADN